MRELGRDFQRDYMAGVYDVVCSECKGDRVIDVLDRSACAPALLAQYDAQEQDLADSYAMSATEMRMGC